MAIAAGGSHSCALDAGGRAWCWGSNSHGQIGVSPRHRVLASPVAVNGTTRFRALVAGERHTCGIALDGRAWCWGANDRGQLGEGTTRDRDSPRPVLLPGPLSRIAAGAAHSCATDAHGVLWCWGANESGQVGPDAGSATTVPVALVHTGLVSAVAAGGSHGCAIAGSGAFCWGGNLSGQLGGATLEDSPLPVRLGGVDIMQALTAGRAHSCGITTTQEVRCWGANDRGQLTRPLHGLPSGTPLPVRGLPSGITGVASGPAGDRSCAADATRVWCWGGIEDPRLGTVTTLPIHVEGLPSASVTAIAVGDRHACGLLAGVVACWGAGESGQLGDGRRQDAERPVTAQPP
jgi:alpha-tubulin suppressor-like RCC1 family protein